MRTPDSSTGPSVAFQRCGEWLVVVSGGVPLATADELAVIDRLGTGRRGTSRPSICVENGRHK